MVRKSVLAVGKKTYTIRELSVLDVYHLLLDAAEWEAAPEAEAFPENLAALARSMDMTIADLAALPPEISQQAWPVFDRLNRALLTPESGGPGRASGRNPVGQLADAVCAMISSGHANVWSYSYDFFSRALHRLAGKSRPKTKPLPLTAGSPDSRKAGNVRHLKAAFLKKFPDGIRVQP